MFADLKFVKKTLGGTEQQSAKYEKSVVSGVNGLNTVSGRSHRQGAFDLDEDYANFREDENYEQTLGNHILGGEVYLKRIDDFMVNTRKGDSLIYIIEKMTEP